MEKKFTIEQKALLGLLSSMQPICSKKTAIDATSNILFQVSQKELVLKSTDLEISLQANCTLVESSMEEVASFLVSGKRIFDIVKELDGHIVFTISDSQIKLQASEVHLALNIKNPEEFPPFPERIENLMHLDAPLLQNMLDSVSFLIPQNNANPALNGLLLEISPSALTMTTTDGHSLAQVSTSNNNFDQTRTWLLPRRAVYELKKILETSEDKTIFLGVCGNQLVFSGELFNFFSKLLADRFPQYQSILDKTAFLPASVDRSKFVKTLKRSACLLSGQFLATKFSFDDNIVRVAIQNKEVGTLDEQLPVNTSETINTDIRFFAPYLLSGIQAFNSNELSFYLKNSTSPIIFESDINNFKMTYLVMPVSPSVG